MAKKVVATLQKGGGKGFTKAIKMVRSPKTGAFTFQEKIVLKEQVSNFLKSQIQLDCNKQLLNQWEYSIRLRKS